MLLVGGTPNPGNFGRAKISKQALLAAAPFGLGGTDFKIKHKALEKFSGTRYNKCREE